jgi:hypothetical protein
MPRAFSPKFVAALNGPTSEAALLYFLTIRHPKLAEPITVVSNEHADNVGDHMLDGDRYYGVPFQLTVLSDDDQPPRGHLSVLNIDRRVGLAAKAMRTRPLVTVKQFAAADFSADQDPDLKARTPIGTPTPEYVAAFMTLTNLKGNALWVEGDLASYVADVGREPASPVRATQDRLPGLFR